jgi:predicted nucleic acid-binding protein
MNEALVDANILLRYLTDEPSGLADRAAELLETAERERIALLVSPLTLAEVVYVLTSVYQWDRGRTAGQLLQLVAASVIEMLERDVVLQALLLYRDTSALSFADAYLAALALSRQIGLISFDRQLRRVSGLRLIDDPARLREEDGPHL